MSLFICPVCGKPLEQQEKSYCCSNRHNFDRAKSGYVNLLPIKGKHSKVCLLYTSELYYRLFDEMGIRYAKSEEGLRVQGTLKSGVCKLSGKISSQFITGLLYALPLLTGDSKIVITDGLESKGYVDMTLEALRTFGVKIENREYQEFTLSLIHI